MTNVKKKVLLRHLGIIKINNAFKLKIVKKANNMIYILNINALQNTQWTF